MTGVANMFGLDMIMIRVGGWDILWSGQVLSVFLLLAVLRSLRHWKWRTHILEVDTSYTIINFNIILATLDLIY